MVQYVVYYVQYDLSTHEYTLELHTLPHSCTDRGQTRLPAVRELFFSHHKNRAKSNKMARLLAFASLLALALAAAAVDATCSVDVRQPWEPVEPPWVFYADQKCPSDSGIVDDAAIWQALQSSNVSAYAEEQVTHAARKTIGGLARPTGLLVAGGELMWLEQDAGEMRKCAVAPARGGTCASAPERVLEGLNCPQDLAIDFQRGLVYVIQFGGGNGTDVALSCGGEGRITRYHLAAAADGSSVTRDVVTGLMEPRYLALDPLVRTASGVGVLFWSDAGYDGGSIMRADVDGANMAQVIHLAQPSGVAVDDSRQALYATQQVRGAAIYWSSYDGRWTRAVSHESLFEPRAIAVDPADGAVVAVELNTFEAGCDPTERGGYGAIVCAERELGRISRVSCAWTADTTTDGQPPAPFQCCCVDAASVHNHLGCTLLCPPPALPPPAWPPQPPAPPPGVLDVNATAPPPPLAVRNYGRMRVENETLIYVGGYVTTGTKATSWGDPTTLALVSAARVLGGDGGGGGGSASGGGGSTSGASSAGVADADDDADDAAGMVVYGKCAPGCGRPTGRDACEPCLAGSYGDGSGVCRLCAPGTYGGNSSRASEVSVACTPCAPGSYNSHHGEMHCEVCPRGSFCDRGFAITVHGLLTLATEPPPGILTPTACPVGTYNPSEGATAPAACLACPEGTHQPLTGATSVSACLVCPPGTASPYQASYCKPCEPSTAQPAAGAPTCDECGPGTYSDSFGATNCSLCPHGSFEPHEGSVTPACRACAPGTYSTSPGATACTACPNQTASRAARATSAATCAPCAEGTFALQAGATACEACPNTTSSNGLGGYTVGLGGQAASLITPQRAALLVSVCDTEALRGAAGRRHGGGRRARSAAIVASSVGAALLALSTWPAERRGRRRQQRQRSGAHAAEGGGTGAGG